MEVITTIIVYQFADRSRVEVEAMLEMRLEETRVYREAREEGRAEGREEGRRVEAENFVVRLLTRRLGQEFSDEVRGTIALLSVPLLEELGEALLDFRTVAELEDWLAAHQ
jgi:predicted transposase YdaD